MSEDTSPTLIPLEEYRIPLPPTDDHLRSLWERFRQRIWPEKEDPFLSDVSLTSAKHRLADLAPGPAFGNAVEIIEQGFGSWLNDSSPARWLQAIVLPPCESTGLVEAWAATRNLAVIQPPAFSERVHSSLHRQRMEAQLDELKGPCVIPRLERWFVRHHRGLDLLRMLLDRLAERKMHCVVGCNSWAWDFLVTVASLSSVFPQPWTLPPQTAVQLGNWFPAIVQGHPNKCLAFRRAQDGKDVMAQKKSGKLEHDFFHLLASSSLGIPWVAWYQWRRSLRLHPETDTTSDADRSATAGQDGHEDVIWVSEPAKAKMPDSNQNQALLVLHALLVHGPLEQKELSTVLPSVDLANVVTVLEMSRLVQRNGNAFSCRPTAYPLIRSRLLSAGIAANVV
ncbi:MAG: hypothetical protein KDA87_19470 [Planctomycetales bacterium]|nr:hypothetical protein [Planctomycetales bacterium]